MSSASSKHITIRIAIDIPVDVAETTLSSITPFLSQLQQISHDASTPVAALEDQTQALDDNEDRKRVRDHYDEQRRLFWIKTVQSHRTFRRIQHNYENDHDAYKLLAEGLQWPTAVLKSQIAAHRRKLKAFIKTRRQRYVLRRILEGASHKTIGMEIGVHVKTVARILRDAKREHGLCS